MTIRDRRQREKEELRREIIDAARELFVAEGYENVSMRKIADRIEYSPTTIYLYFRDKSELLREICESAFEQLADEVIISWKTAETPIERLRSGMLAYINFGLTHPHHYDVVFISPKEKFISDEDYAYEGSMGQRAFELLSISVAECIEAGAIKPGSVDLLAQTLWAGIHGVTSLLITHENFPFADREDLIGSVVESLIQGLRP